MSISTKLNSAIETNMNSLKKSNMLRSGRGIKSFLKEFSSLLGQVSKDRATLEAIGFDYSLMDEYKAILEKLVIIYEERIVSEGSVDDVVKKFRDEMVKAKENQKILSIVIRYIIARNHNSDIKHRYDIIRKGKRQIDVINNIIAMVNIIKHYPELSSEIVPRGQVIDNEFLDNIHKQTINLAILKGQADVVVHETNISVDRLNRIISLAVAAEREMKLYAELAFSDDIDRYNKNYASAALRIMNQSRKKKE